jgi:hypothetical protein
MADNGTTKPFGSPDKNEREWGNTEGNFPVEKQPGTPKSTAVINHKLQHSDYETLAGGGVKGGAKIKL